METDPRFLDAAGWGGRNLHCMLMEKFLKCNHRKIRMRNNCSHLIKPMNKSNVN